MEQYSKDILVKLQIEKAKRFLDQAEEMCALKHWDLAANRYYYACYHAVQGLFIQNNLPTAKKNAGVVTQFSKYFVKTGIVSTTLGSFMARMMQLRQKADYNCFYDITEEELKEYVALSKELIGKVENLISHV